LRFPEGLEEARLLILARIVFGVLHPTPTQAAYNFCTIALLNPYVAPGVTARGAPEAVGRFAGGLRVRPPRVARGAVVAAGLLLPPRGARARGAAFAAPPRGARPRGAGFGAGFPLEVLLYSSFDDPLFADSSFDERLFALASPLEFDALWRFGINIQECRDNFPRTRHIKMNRGVLVEALAIGVMTALVLMAARRVTTVASDANALLVGFVIGVLIHLACEFTGINAWYCRHGSACSA